MKDTAIWLGLSWRSFPAMVVALLSGPAQADDAIACSKLTGEPAIRGCTSILEKARIKGAQSSSAVIAKTYYNRGLHRLNIGKLEESIADFSEALSVDPSLAPARFDRANAYKRYGWLDRAIADYGYAIDSKFRTADAYFGRGNSLAQQGLYEAAVADLQKAMAADVAHSGAKASLAVAIKLEQEQAALRSKIEKSEGGAEELANLGSSFASKGRLDSALPFFDKAVRLNPKLASAYGGRSFVRHGLGMWESALADSNAEIALNPENTIAYFNRGILNKKMFNDELAIVDFGRVIEKSPKYLQAYIERGYLLAKQRRFDKSLNDLDKAIELNSRSALAHLNRSVVLRAMGRFDEGFAAYNLAVKLDPRLGSRGPNVQQPPQREQ